MILNVPREYLDNCEKVVREIFEPADITIVEADGHFMIISSLHNGYFKYTFITEKFDKYDSVDSVKIMLKQHNKAFTQFLITQLKIRLNQP